MTLPTTYDEIPEFFNAAEWLIDRQCEEGRGDKVAVICDGVSHTYAEVKVHVDGMVSRMVLDKRPVGCRVLIACHDSMAFIAAFLGAMKMGAVPVPVNPNLPSDEYLFLLRDSGAPIFVCEPGIALAIAERSVEAPVLRDVWMRTVTDDEMRMLFHRRLEINWEQFDSAIGSCDWRSDHRTHRDDAAFWLYSSGSTGKMKGAIHLHHDIPLTAGMYAGPILGVTADDRCFSIAKLFFAYGLGNALTFPFAVGATTILDSAPRFAPDRVLSLAEAEKPTLFFGVPTAYAALLRHAREAGEYDLSSIRACVSAGEALPASVYERWRKRFGGEILDGIGSTEMLHIFISNRLGEVVPGASGSVVPGYEARIVDERGTDVAAGETGNLWVKGDTAAAGYWRSHQRSQETFLGPWTVTGDKYHRDERGVYWYEGRADDMLKISGQWVSPVEVENALMAHPSVGECGVAGVPDADTLTKSVAYVVLGQDAEPSDELGLELIAFVRQGLAPHKAPHRVVFTKELPKTATGKIQRFRLRALGFPDAQVTAQPEPAHE